MTGDIEQVGAPDPELKTSLIIEELAEDFEVLEQEAMEEPVCYFNDKAYPDGAYVRSGHTLLRCERGAWIRSGSSDPDNP